MHLFAIYLAFLRYVKFEKVRPNKNMIDEFEMRKPKMEYFILKTFVKTNMHQNRIHHKIFQPIVNSQAFEFLNVFGAKTCVKNSNKLC